MEDPPGSYAPRSPDLSALASASSYARNDEVASSIPGMDNHTQNNSTTPIDTGPFLLPPQTAHPSSYVQSPQPRTRRDSYSMSQTSYYQPPPLLQQQATSSYGYSQFAYPSPVQQSMPPQLKQMKSEPIDPSWPTTPQQSLHSPLAPLNSSKRGAKGSAANSPVVLKSEEPSEPRVPAPGELEGVVVRTKFPVARIKRIVQADDEVGKVAQATPVAVGKALELFMIHVTLASASIATGGVAFGENKGGTKRITKTHIKSAILKHDEFDFLRPIAEKIPDGHGGSGKAVDGKGAKGKGHKGDSDEDAEFDMDDGDEDGSGTYGSKAKRAGAARETSSRRAQRGMG